MKLLLATGGTGGHIYPAIALGEALENEGHQIFYAGSTNRMEAKIIKEKNYPFVGFELTPVHKKTDKIKQIFQLAFGSLKMIKFLKKENIDLVLGFGSYITAPSLVAAKILNIPIILHEQNSSIGKTNEIFSKTAESIITCYSSVKVEVMSKLHLLGNPRASEVLKIKKDESFLRKYQLVDNKKTILIVMGSLGSETVNSAVKNSLEEFKDDQIQIIFVTGKEHFQEYQSLELADHIKVVPYIDQAQALLHTSLAVVRGGATTAAEICALGVPSIIVPSPYVSNNHQYINAMELVNADAANILTEEELINGKLKESIDSIIYDDLTLKQMAENARNKSFPNATNNIIALIEKVVHEN